MMPEPKLTVPSKLRRGGLKSEEWSYIDSGRDLLAYMAGALGLNDLGNSRVLDMGCGTKFTQAILNYDIRVGEYVGVDVYGQMIDFLRASVSDSRFSFHHMDLHNAMYNPSGETLSVATQLPLEKDSFDVICLFSVFTHLAPADYTNMLRLLRPYVKASGKLIYSLYIDELSHNGHGLIEQVVEDNRDTWKPSGDDFRDAFPGKPLQWALYSRKHAIELIAETGWEVEELCMPNAHSQHHFICRPI